MEPRNGVENVVGWVSIGAGMGLVLAPERVGRALGMEDWSELIRAYGFRQVVAGMGILALRPGPWVWSRLTGDVLDLLTLATRTGPDNPRRRRVTTAMAAVSGIALLDLACCIELARRRRA
ncbi:MAG TPA: hypothetical protein VF647_07735 [Longimicrobium sp.]|jgi:hypothetical protein